MTQGTNIPIGLTCKGPVHTTTEKFENGVFALKTHQMFSVHTTLEKFETHQSTAILDLCLQGNHVIIVTSLISKSSVFKMFSVYTFSLRSVFEKLSVDVRPPKCVLKLLRRSVNWA